MSLKFKPTPHQTGHAIGLAVANLTERLTGGADHRRLAEAGISQQHYESELLLLGASAAMHVIESCDLGLEVENSVATGMFSWVRGLPTLPRDLLLQTLDEATDYYAEAALIDSETPPAEQELSELEIAFGERLLSAGENNEVRGQACVLLSVLLPKLLWSAQTESARQMLRDASLILSH